jgi:hypothetical protein
VRLLWSRKRSTAEAVQKPRSISQGQAACVCRHTHVVRQRHTQRKQLRSRHTDGVLQLHHCALLPAFWPPDRRCPLATMSVAVAHTWQCHMYPQCHTTLVSLPARPRAPLLHCQGWCSRLRNSLLPKGSVAPASAHWPRRVSSCIVCYAGPKSGSLSGQITHPCITGQRCLYSLQSLLGRIKVACSP